MNGMESFFDMVHLLSLALLCGLANAAQDSLFFRPQPEDVTATEGYPARLRCGASEEGNVTFYWTLDGQRIEDDSRRRMQGSDLVVLHVSTLYDIGEFKCVASHAGKSIVSRGAQINILWLTDSVRVIEAEQSEELSFGDELVLRCKAEGNPEPQVTWFKNGVQIYRDERISFRGNQLHILDLTIMDNGMYSCMVINDVGSLNSSENYALRLSDESSPHLTNIPRNTVVKVNSTARFECAFENAVTTKWLFENKVLQNSSRFLIYPDGNLQISSVEFKDVGLYQCVGKGHESSSASDQVYAVQLQIANIDDFTSDSLEPSKGQAVVTVHDAHDVTCLPPKGFPRPKMWWEDPKGHVINDSGRVLVKDMRLIFTEVQKSDAGEYACYAENIADKKKIAFALTVAAAPVILKHPTDILTNEGESANFECLYNNTLSAVVVWLKEEMYLRDTGNHVTMNNRSGSMTIRNVSPSDAGTYQCEVRSEGFPPVHSKTAVLTVKEKLKFIPAPVNRKLELGSNAKLYCKAGGSTPPVVKWSRTDVSPSEWPPHIRDDNGTLHFNRVLSTDTGKYMCVATNSQGIINATIDVDVIVMPKFSVLPADTEANEGESVMLHCLAEGDPLPIIQWDKNNELNGFSHVRFKVLSNGSLYASEVHVDDEGKYGCTAGNSGGLRRHEVLLTVTSKDPNTNRIGRGGFGTEENTMTKTVAITLGAAGVYIVLVVSLMMWCRYRRAKRKALMLAHATADAENSDVHDIELKDRTPLKTCNDVGTAEENTEFIRNSTVNKLLYPREKLSTVMLLGHGEYGEVFLAKATGISGESVETVVMVKALESKNEKAVSEFNKEMSMYAKMKHENVGTILGLCQETKPHYMIMDYTDWGDLKQFLLATRAEETSKAPKQAPLSVPQSLIICQQVAVGMEHLSKVFTHRDLAARNCLISSSFKIKVSSPCLSMDTYLQEYHQQDSRMIPLRWAPAEAVIGNNWSPKSDIWSFAVLVWEVFNKAEMPYSELTNEEVLQKLKTGDLGLTTPTDMPESLVKFLEKCWSPNSNDRPSFSEAVAVFVELSVAVQM